MTNTTNRNLQLPAHNSNIDTWDVNVNADTSIIDSAFGGLTAINVTSASGTVTLSNSTGSPPSYICPIFELTGTLTANVNYQFPSGVGGNYVVSNGTTGAFSVTFSSAGGGTSTTIAQGKTTLVTVDGTNVFLSISALGPLAVSGALTATSVTASAGVVGASLSISGHATLEGVTSTGATGTGKLVFDGSPTFTGTANFASISATNIGTTNISATAFSGGSFSDGNTGTGYRSYSTGAGLDFTYATGISGTGSQFNVTNTSAGVALLPGGTSWGSLSDWNAKVDFEPIPVEGALSRVASWRAGTYHYVDDAPGERRRVGLVAQDVQKDRPEAVTDIDGLLKLCLTEVIPDLVAALAETKRRLEALEASKRGGWESPARNP